MEYIGSFWNAHSSVIFDHHIVWKSQICSLKKLTSKGLYLILVDGNTVKPHKISSRILLNQPSVTGKIYLLILNTNLKQRCISSVCVSK